jgi:hypothetical protein
MRLLLVVVLSAGLRAGADAQDDAGVLTELKKLQGTWVLVSGEVDGQQVADEHVKKSQITWKGKECSVDTPPSPPTPRDGRGLLEALPLIEVEKRRRMPETPSFAEQRLNYGQDVQSHDP